MNKRLTKAEKERLMLDHVEEYCSTRDYIESSYLIKMIETPFKRQPYLWAEFEDWINNKLK